MPPSLDATLTEMYGTLNELVAAYTQVMMTFSSVVTELGELRNEVADLREFNRGQLTDALAARNIWRDTAQAHKEDATRLRVQLAALLAEPPRETLLISATGKAQ